MNNNLVSSSESRIYATHGKKQQLLGVRAIVNGQRSLAYIKGNELIAYEPYESILRQLLDDGPFGKAEESVENVLFR